MTTLRLLALLRLVTTLGPVRLQGLRGCFVVEVFRPLPRDATADEAL
jgi:hypothetical protein